MSKRRAIKFTNMEATRVGKGIGVLRSRANMSLAQLAKAVGIEEDYLNRLEEGHEPEAEQQILESIAQNVGVLKRGNGLTSEQLVNIFLYVSQEVPPKLF